MTDTQAGSPPDRMAQFRAEMTDLDVKAPVDGDDHRLLVVGVALTAIGVAAIVLGYWSASGTSNPLDQIPAMISGGLMGLALVIAGAALFVRYSLTRFMRYWLIRQVYEQRLQTDRTVEAIERLEAVLRQNVPSAQDR